MKKYIIIGVLILSLIAVLLAGCASPAANKLKVIAGTSLVTYIVQQVGGDRVDVVNLVPPSNHPGNFDVKPDDMKTLASAKLFLLQGVPGETYVDKLVASANNPNLTVVKASVAGNWMIPLTQAAATDRIAEILSQVDPANASEYQKAASAYKQRIQAKEVELKSKLAEANISKINAIASIRQADFLQWAGVYVVGTYASPDALTPQVVKDLMDKALQAKSLSSFFPPPETVVVNNLQDSKDAGKAIAEELGAKQINLSNFPGGLDNTETWEKAIDRNVDLLIEAAASG